MKIRAVRWLAVAKVVWIAMALLLFGLWAVGSTVLLFTPVPDCIQVRCDPVDFNAGDLRTAQEMGLSTGFFSGGFTAAITILSGLSYFAIAGVIFTRKSNDWMGLLVSFTLFFFRQFVFFFQ